MSFESAREAATKIESHGRPVDYIFFSSPLEFLRHVGGHLGKSIPRTVARGTWNGLHDQSPENLHERGYSTSAMANLERAVAALPARFSLGGRVRPAAAGGAWVVPLALQSNPMSARIRPREKLAPLNLRIRLDPIAYNDEQILANSVAAVARALWDYQLAGGVVTLTVITTYNYSHKTQWGTDGFLFETRLPLTDIASLALGCSVPLVRVLSFSLGSAFSPRGYDEGFPMCQVFPEDEIRLSGDATVDKAALDALNIQIPE